MSWILVLVIVVVLCILLGTVVVIKTPSSALWCGALLVAFALGASLYASSYLPRGTVPEQVQYVINSLLVAASVGANLMAGSICFYLREKPQSPALAPAQALTFVPSSSQFDVATVSSVSTLPVVIVSVGIGAVIGLLLGSRRA